ncbi:MAG: response regulator [Candidatus Kapabacteria bacterium]|nr:response regulator [Candidatus Kapabacteria bacterium]
MKDFSVLIIDDDIWMQRILSKTLEGFGFKRTLLASNGFDGIALAVEHVPSIIICDILMPDLNGHLTLRVLKSINKTKNIPVLMVSALSDVENLGLSVKSGAAGYISKPFTRMTVFDKLANVIGRDELEMISRGESVPYNDEDHLAETQTYTSYEKPVEYSTSVFDDNSPSQTASASSSDSPADKYQEDEKKSIESIKKLLLKNKK